MFNIPDHEFDAVSAFTAYWQQCRCLAGPMLDTPEGWRSAERSLFKISTGQISRAVGGTRASSSAGLSHVGRALHCCHSRPLSASTRTTSLSSLPGRLSGDFATAACGSEPVWLVPEAESSGCCNSSCCCCCVGSARAANASKHSKTKKRSLVFDVPGPKACCIKCSVHKLIKSWHHMHYSRHSRRGRAFVPNSAVSMAVRSAQRLLALRTDASKARYASKSKLKAQNHLAKWSCCDYLYQVAVHAYAELRRP